MKVFTIKVCGCFLFILFLFGCHTYNKMLPLLSADAISAIDPHELQKWAIDLIANLPKNLPDEMPAIPEDIIPASIKSLKKREGSDLHAYYDGIQTNKLNGFRVSSECIRGEYAMCVTIAWSSKNGHNWGLNISHSSFRPIVHNASLSEWIPGVYFYEVPPD